MDAPDLAAYNVIATFPDEDTGRGAVAALHDQGIDAKHISYLGRRAAERADDLEAPEAEGGERGSAPPSAEEIHTQVPKRAAGTAVAGAGVGGAAGALAGLAAVAIPGVGPAIGAGVLAAAAGGAAAGGVAGGVAGGITKMWEMHYRDAVAEGSALVGVHEEDPKAVHGAAQTLLEHRPLRLDHLDKDGNLLDE